MSYASITKSHIPEGEMPQPDQHLLDGHFAGETPAHADADSKVNVLPAGSDVNHPDLPEHKPATLEPIVLHPPPVEEPHTSDVAPKPLPSPKKEEVHLPDSGASWEKKEKKAEKEAKEVKKSAKDMAGKAEKEVQKGLSQAEKKGKEYAKKAKAELDEAEARLSPYWEKTKDVVLRPGTLGGLLGVVNVGLLGTIGYFAYTRRDMRVWDRRIVAGAVAGPLALFAAEGYLADSYLSTPEGRQEAERAKREGSKLYLQAKQRVLQPEVAGGLVGVVNVAIIGTLGYLSYQNWNRPWDNRVVTATAVGLAALSALEGWAGTAYAERH